MTQPAEIGPGEKIRGGGGDQQTNKKFRGSPRKSGYIWARTGEEI